MRSPRLLLPLLPLALLPCAWLPAAGSSSPDGPRWLSDPHEAFASAAESGRPILAVFR